MRERERERKREREREREGETPEPSAIKVGARREEGWWFMRSISGINVKFP